MSSKLIARNSSDRRYFWLERLIAVFALVNLALVLFDLSYLTLRSLYLQATPALVQLYDPVKGVRPHPETQAYLNRVALLESQVVRVGVDSVQIEPLLSELRERSRNLSQHHPFAGKDGDNTIQTIEQQLRNRTGTEAAFDRFWSQSYLTPTNWQSEIAFWHDRIRPLMAANYYREVNRFGFAVDYFWSIDLPFILVLTIDILLRVRAIHQRHPELSWLESAVRRWYDLFLLVPVWRWLRVIPVFVRLYKVDLVNLDLLRAEAKRDLAIGFAAELTEMVGIQAIDRLQDSIRDGDVMRWLLYPEMRPDYVQVNGQNEVKVIASRLVEMIANSVLPKVQDDIQNLVNYSIVNTVNQLPIYQQLQRLPGVDRLPNPLVENLAKSLSQLVYNNLVQTLADPTSSELATRLSQNFRDSLEIELQKKHNTKEMESLLVDLLEEIKINYVRGIAEVGIETLVDEAAQLRHKLGVRNFPKINSSERLK